MDLAELVESLSLLLQKCSNKLLRRYNWGAESSKVIGRGVPVGFGGFGGVQVPGKEEVKDVGTVSRGKGLKHLSNEEYREKQMKGLCFFYEERFTPELVCTNKNFRFIIIEYEPEESGDAVWHNVVEDLREGGPQLQLDYRKMAGQITPRSLRLWEGGEWGANL